MPSHVGAICSYFPWVGVLCGTHVERLEDNCGRLEVHLDVRESFWMSEGSFWTSRAFWRLEGHFGGPEAHFGRLEGRYTHTHRCPKNLFNSQL